MKKYMLTKSIFSIVFLCSFLLLCAFADSKVAVPEYLWVEYGPPASANTWEKFTIPLTAETFNLDSETFSQSMQNIGMFRIRTEMHDGTDFGAVDNVKVGSLFFSSFSTGTENWNAMGDGTMSWQSSGGVSGGYIQISDWASGDWHWAVAPDSWQGDWSSLIGQNLEFYYKTNYPDYSSRIELYTSIMNRISLSATSTTLYPGSDTQVEVKLIPTPNQSVTVSLSSSDNSSITVPASVTFSAGQNSALITVEASADITEEKTCVITATASGYSTSRLTLTVIVSEGATLTGTVKDAITGSPIEDATVTVAGLSDQTDSEGSYTIVNVPVGTLIADFIGTPRSGDAPLTVQFNDQSSSGSQQVNASASGYIEYVNNNVVILGDQTTTLDISLSPQLSGEALRFVLNWGADPRDLDSYLKTPEIGGSNYTVYYDNTGSESDVPYATLDHDVILGYGPETMTIHQMHPGTYYYYIHRYAGGGTVSSSSAVVQIYNANGLLRSIQVPTSGDDDYWNVCTIDGATSSVTVINQIQSSAPGSKGAEIALPEKKPEEAFSSRSGPAYHPCMEITSREWNFGDGQTSTDPNPSHVYQNPGTYTVSLTVSDGVNQVTETKTNYIAVAGSSNGTLSGRVSDATTGIGISGATVSVGSLSDITDSEGNYTIQNVPVGTLIADFTGNPRSGTVPLTVQFSNQSSSGSQQVAASASGYIEYVNNHVIIQDGQITTLDISLSPELSGEALRFVLNWGADPRDLDSYLKTPEIGGSNYTVYYSNTGSESDAPYATLDHDVTQGYGPETMTIHQMHPGTYYYYIHRYAGSGMISSSSAVVQIYNAGGLLRSVQVTGSGEGDYWNVCTIDGATGSVTVINQIQSGSPGSKSSFKSGSIAEKHFFPDGKELYKTASIQDIVSYSWDFGDGQSSSDPDPTHIYQNAGSYTVSLTVSDGSNQVTETKTNYISVSGGLSELVLLNESFEGDVSNWSYIDNNNDDVYWQIYYEESPPDTVAHTGIHGAGIWYNTSGNDDYLITPQIEIPAGAQDVTLSFWSHSHSASYLESFSVKISTGGKDVNDFSTTIIGSQTAPYDWTEYEYDNLAAYAGQSIYIAFHNTSVDKWYQWLDDVRVVAQVQTAIDEPNVTAGAEEFALYSNYPNPFNPTTTISYQLASASFVKISIYDARGKLVETLVNEQKDRGNYSVVWDASGLSSGIYIYKITAGKYSNVNKCLLIR